MNMYRQYFLFSFFIDLLFSYNIIIKEHEYVKLRLSKMNLENQYIYIFNIFKKKLKVKNNKKKNNDVVDEVAQ